MAQTAGGTYYAASSELVSSWPATSLDLANQLESRFAAKANLSSATFTGAISVQPASGGATVTVDSPSATTEAALLLRKNTGTRWQIVKTAVNETGSNAGSNFQINRFSDAGAFLDAGMQIRRSDGLVQMQGVYNLTTAFAANVFVDSSGGMYRSTSSLKYKTDVQDATAQEQDAIINGLRPVTYKSLSDADDADARWWGFIAEEVEEVDPRLVNHGEDGSPEGVQYDRIIPALVGYIQRLEARLAVLEAK